jgi:nitroreductase
VTALRVGEVEPGQQAPRLGRIVVRHRRLEVLALRGRLPQLAAKPAQEAHLRLLGHRAHYATRVDAFLAIASRRDERRYSGDPLDDAVVERILDAGRLAGSAGNRQPWTFVVPTSRQALEALAAAVFVPGNVLGAGLVVAVVVSGKGPVSFDAGRAAQNMLITAWNEGIASCPNGIDDKDGARAALELADDETPVIVLSFGRPQRARDPESRPAAEWSDRANRRPLEHVVRRLDG